VSGRFPDRSTSCRSLPCRYDIYRWQHQRGFAFVRTDSDRTGSDGRSGIPWQHNQTRSWFPAQSTCPMARACFWSGSFNPNPMYRLGASWRRSRSGTMSQGQNDPLENGVLPYTHTTQLTYRTKSGIVGISPHFWHRRSSVGEEGWMRASTIPFLSAALSISSSSSFASAVRSQAPRRVCVMTCWWKSAWKLAEIACVAMRLNCLP